MKNIIKLFVLGLVFLPAIASASTNVDLSPLTKSVKEGEVFTVNVNISPSGESVYTSKVSLTYTNSLLEVVSFTFAPTWLALSQPGYDLIDQANGSIIKTAGYPGGMTSTKTFGTITFKAKKSGVANITVAKNTEIYDANNKNTFSGIQSQVKVDVTKVEIKPVTKDVVVNKNVPKDTKVEATNQVQEKEVVATSTPMPIKENQNLAAVAESGAALPYLNYVLIIAISFILGFVVGRKTAK